MFKLLSYHQGCKFENGILDDFDDDEPDPEDLKRCFNEARDIAIKYYLSVIKKCPDNDYDEDEEDDIENFDVL